MRKYLIILFSALIFAACHEQDKSQSASFVVRLKDVPGLSVKWTVGDCLFLADDLSSARKVSVSRDMISDDGTLVADFGSLSQGYGKVFAVKATQTSIVKGSAEIVPAIDGSLKDAFIAAGSCSPGENVITLAPVLGIVEFSLAHSGVYGVRIRARSDIFPVKAKYSFDVGKGEMIKASSTVEVPALSPVRVFIPVADGVDLNGCVFEFQNEKGETLASWSCDRSVKANAGEVASLGQIDAGVVFPEQGTSVADEMSPAAEIMPLMGIGLNLCGTFDDVLPYQGVTPDRSDPLSFETLHKQGVTTQATMDSMYEAGFRCIRIPITWYAHMDNTLSSIDKVFLDRIEEVVGYALKAGLYCIINVHHDTGTNVNTWIWADIDKYPNISPGFKNIWGQIARRFRDYDDKLLFEGYNELLDVKQSWGYPKVQGAIEAANRLNQDFVDAVRATGGRNYARNLIVSTYATSTSLNALEEFVMPEDRLPGRLIVQVHSYIPWSFCSPNSGGQTELKASDETDIEDDFKKIKTGILDKGYPCILGEYGAFPLSTRTHAQLGHHAAVYTRLAMRNGVVPVYWYNPMAYQNRTTGTWSYPAIKDSLINASRKY